MSSSPLDFTIVTPAFHQLEWLRLCAASILDQQGATVEYIVQDGSSDPATAAWAATQPRVQLVGEKDSGMYDAVNRGMRRGSGRYCAYLNCDEQYLPGVLARVKGEFEANPEVDVLFCGAIVVDGECRYLCSRPVELPRRRHTVTDHLATFTCSMFWRRGKTPEFDQKFKDLGDADWVVRLLDAGVKMKALSGFSSTFADTGENRNLQAQATDERREFLHRASALTRALRRVWVIEHRLRRMAKGFYHLPPFDYAIYTHASPDQRVATHIEKPVTFWKSRL